MIKWFKCYFSNSKFLVNINNKSSSLKSVTCGVQLGLILGPLLFLLYVNDMPQAVNSKLLLYANDSCILYQHKNIKDI